MLGELGFDERFFNVLRADYLEPITKQLFPDWGGDSLDSHRAFIVIYKTEHDVDLDYHFDNAELTLNVSLNQNFEGGSVYFGNMAGEEATHKFIEYRHIPTVGCLHRGQHLHGAMPITEGNRYNLILWMRSSEIRNQKCPMCGEKPRLEKTEGFGDGFTAVATGQQETVNVCCIH